MRDTGYNAVSFRDIASEMGIKSASLHYHFPKKEDLGEALVSRYSEHFMQSVTALSGETPTPMQAISAFIKAYELALTQDEQICLCAMFSAESPGLPEKVQEPVKAFFNRNLDWLSQHYAALGYDNPAQEAEFTQSLVQGAMMLANVTGNTDVFHSAVKRIVLTD